MQDTRIHDELSSRTYPFFEEDVAQPNSAWQFERIGGYGLCLLVLFTLLGLFSSGSLGVSALSNADGSIVVEHQRFYHDGAPASLVLDAEVTDKQSIVLSGDFLDAFAIDSIQPQPLSSGNTSQGLALVFAPDAQGKVRVQLSLRPHGVGPYRGKVSIAGREPVRFNQFIYP
jgi:hypothetical protein